MSASEVGVAVEPLPPHPLISPSTPFEKGPSVRESTIVMTQWYGPKVGHHVSPAELQQLETPLHAAPTSHPLLPSVRESTIRMAEVEGPKVGHHVPPQDLPPSQRIVPQVERPTRYPPGPATSAASAAPVLTESPTTVPALTEAAAAAAAPPPAAPTPVLEVPLMEDGIALSVPDASIAQNAVNPELVTRDAAGQLPSVRESTIRMAEVEGPKVGHHVPPQDLPVAQTRLREGASASHRAEVPHLPMQVPTVVASVSSAAALDSSAVAAPTPVAPALARRDAQGRLPSVRESTVAVAERLGPKQPNHVPPQELGNPHPVQGSMNHISANTSSGALKHDRQYHPTAAAESQLQRGNAITSKGGSQTTASSLVAKPIREWEGQDVRAAVSNVISSPIVMNVLAVGAAALTVFSIYKGVEMYNRYQLSRSIAEVEKERPTVLHLYIHRRSPLAPSVSIACTRVETLLRLAHVPYEAHVITDASVSPNGELPFVVFNGMRVAGAQNITEVIAKELGVNLDVGLTSEDRATGVAILAAVHYSLTRGYLRSVHVERCEVMRPYYSEMNRTPDWVTLFALRRMRKSITTVNDQSGYSMLTSEQYVHELLKDVTAVEALLEQHTYLFHNDYPSSYDCALYAWLLPVVAMEDAAEVNEAFAYIVESEPLTTYVRNMTMLAFPDLDELVIGPFEEGEGSPSEGATARRRSSCREEGSVVDDAEESRELSLTAEPLPSPPISCSRRRRLLAARARPSESSHRGSVLSLGEFSSAAAVEEEEENGGQDSPSVHPSQREMLLPGEKVR